MLIKREEIAYKCSEHHATEISVCYFSHLPFGLVRPYLICLILRIIHLNCRVDREQLLEADFMEMLENRLKNIVTAPNFPFFARRSRPISSFSSRILPDCRRNMVSFVKANTIRDAADVVATINKAPFWHY